MFGIKTKTKAPAHVPLPPIKTPSRLSFDLNQRLLSFSPTDHWTLRDACQGTQIMGGTGSGKTTGSGRSVALSFLSHGYGGLVLCAKPGERRLWESYAKETGREKSLIVFDGSGRRHFNFLDYELRRGDRLVTHNLVTLFMRIMEAAKGREGGGGGQDGFWKDAAAELLSNAFLILYAAWGEVTLSALMELISSAPRTEAQAEQDEWRNRSYCWKSIFKMVRDPANRIPEHDAQVAANFFGQRWAGASDKMRTSIEFTLSSMAAPFLTGYLRELFCTTTDTLPEFTHEGAILVIDLPVKEHGEAGILAQHIWKYLWQRAAERRDGDNPQTRPVFLWADECQFFVSKYDSEFQSTARSSKACTVYLTQSLAAYIDRMGPGSEQSVNALLNNFQTRIFHQNLEPGTNQYAADLVGQAWLTLRSDSRSEGESKGHNVGLSYNSGGSWSSSGDGKSSGSTNWGRGFSEGKNFGTTKGINISHSQQVQHQVLPSEFARLRQGGRDGAPQAIVVQGGRMFKHTGKPWIMCEFPQS